MSIRENILEAVLTLLETVPGATAYRSREEPAERAEGIVILLKPEEEPTELRAGGAMPGGAGLSLRNLTLVITVLARGAIPDQIADPVMTLIHSTLMADRTLGGLCALMLEQGTKWDFEMADGTAMAAEMRYTVRYQTSATSLSI